jgi:uncharacterized protein YjiS (DUF1127 family)
MSNMPMADGAEASAITVPLSAISSIESTPLIHLDDNLRNEVYSMGPHHQQTNTRQLSRLEKFYVQVAEVYQHQLLEKHAKEAEQVAAAQKAAGGDTPFISGSFPPSWPFGKMEQKLLMARYQVDNIVQTIEQILRTAGHKGVLAQAGGAAAQQQQQQPPVLGISERNLDGYEQKLRSEAALQSEQRRLDRENGIATAAHAMSDDTAAPSAIESEESAQEALAEFMHGDDLDELGRSGGGGGDDVRMLLDPSDQLLGGVSLATRRNRLGTLVMLKRRQYTSARDIFLQGMSSVRKSIESERKFLHGVGELAKSWTIRTVPADVAASMPPLHPQSGAATAALAAQGGQPIKGAPLFNPYQAGLSAGATTPYPCLMIDYRIGTLDISLDRGKTWLYRNDAGEIFVDESVGKVLESNANKKSGKTEEVTGTSSSTVKVEDEHMKEVTDVPAASSAPTPSWLSVSQRLHRAQHYLLYKHLYSALMHEARELRILSHKEQQKLAASSLNTHGTGSTTASSGTGISTSALIGSSAATPSAAVSAVASSFLPPPAAHTGRPWSISDVSTRRIRVDMLGFYEGMILEWREGVHQPFNIRTTKLDDNFTSTDATNADPEQLPEHLSLLLVNQCMNILLEQTQKNSLGNRRTLELLGLDDNNISVGGGVNPLRRDMAVSSTGVGSSGTGQEDTWPARAPSMLQFLTMAVNHWRLSKQIRQQLSRLQKAENKDIPLFRVKYSNTKQPYLLVFNVLVGDRTVCETRLKGVHLSILIRMPTSSSPSPALTTSYAAFGLAPPHATSESLRTKSFDAKDYAVAQTILCTNAQHFADVLTTALRWFR